MIQPSPEEFAIAMKKAIDEERRYGPDSPLTRSPFWHFMWPCGRVHIRGICRNCGWLEPSLRVACS